MDDVTRRTLLAATAAGGAVGRGTADAAAASAGGTGPVGPGSAGTEPAGTESAGTGPAGTGAGLITRLRSGRIPCGRNQRNTTMSRPIATHCSDGIRFGGRLLEVGM